MVSTYCAAYLEDVKLSNPTHGLKACEETRIAEGQILGPRHP
jgi:hypothetical protein